MFRYVKIILVSVLLCACVQQVHTTGAQKTRELAHVLIKRELAQQYLKIVQTYNQQELEALRIVLQDLHAAKDACKYSALATIFSAYQKNSNEKKLEYSGTKEVLRETMAQADFAKDLLCELEKLEAGPTRDIEPTALDVVLARVPDNQTGKPADQLVEKLRADLEALLAAYTLLFKKYNMLV